MRLHSIVFESNSVRRRVGYLTPPPHYKYGLPRPYKLIQLSPHPTLANNIRSIPMSSNTTPYAFTDKQANMLVNMAIQRFEAKNARVQTLAADLRQDLCAEDEKEMGSLMLDGLVSNILFDLSSVVDVSRRFSSTRFAAVLKLLRGRRCVPCTITSFSCTWLLAIVSKRINTVVQLNMRSR